MVLTDTSGDIEALECMQSQGVCTGNCRHMMGGGRVGPGGLIQTFFFTFEIDGFMNIYAFYAL